MADRHAPDISEKARFQEITVHRFPFMASLAERNPRAILQVRGEIERIADGFAAELVHVNALNPSLMFLQESRLLERTRLLVTLHAELPPAALVTDHLYGHILQSADWIVFPSHFLLDDTRRHVPALIADASVIPHAVDGTKKSANPLKTDPPRLLCLGRLVDLKGFDLAIRAMPRVIEHFPSARLVIAGDGPARPELASLADKLGLTRTVDFLGWVPPPQVPSLLDGATLVIVPSRQETFGITALEAAAFGRPVIAARVGGLPEVIDSGRTGLLIEPGNSDALASAVITLLGDRGRLVEMGEAARQHAADRFSWRRTVDAYDALYAKLAAGPADS